MDEPEEVRAPQPADAQPRLQGLAQGGHEQAVAALQELLHVLPELDDHLPVQPIGTLPLNLRCLEVLIAID